MSEYSNRSNKGTVVIFIVVLVLAASAGAWYMFQYEPEQEAKEKARQEQIAKEAAENKRKELEAQNKAKYAKLIEDANTEYEQGNWQRAHSLYTEASSLFPKEQYPQGQLVLLNSKLDEIALIEARRSAGIVDTVSSPTGRYYVIVSSSIDDDLAMDYAIKLAEEGNSPKIIKHDTGKLLYYRVALGNYDTRKQAENDLASFKTYGSGVWVLAY